MMSHHVSMCMSSFLQDDITILCCSNFIVDMYLIEFKINLNSIISCEVSYSYHYFISSLVFSCSFYDNFTCHPWVYHTEVWVCTFFIKCVYGESSSCWNANRCSCMICKGCWSS